MAQVNEADVLERLKSVMDPDSGKDIVSQGMVTGLVLKDGNVGFSIEVAPEKGPTSEPMRKAAEEAGGSFAFSRGAQGDVVLVLDLPAPA